MSRPDRASSNIRQAFNKAFARGFVIFAAGAASVAQAEEPATTPVTDIYAVQAAQQDAARSKFTDLVIAADPAGYGARLAALETSLNNRLRQQGTENQRHDSAFILNPAEIDVGIMLDEDLASLLQAHIAARGGKANDERIQMTVGQLKETIVTAGGTGTFTQAPMAVLQMPENGRATCIIIPAPEHDKPYDVIGLTTRQMEDFLNLHEGWHCLDTKNGATAEEKDALASVNTLADLRGNILAQRALAAINHQEALADVGAAGDMIRAGASPLFVRRIIDWRESPAEVGLEHNTVPALQALEKHINTVGIAAFRAADDKTAAQLYTRIAGTHGLSQPRLQTALDHLFSPQSAGDATQTYYNQRFARIDADLKRGGFTPAPEGAAEKGARIRHALENWDARDVLEREAMRRHGEITLENLVYAYGGLKSQLQQDIKSGGAAAVVKHEQLSRLRIELVLMATHEYDFVDANRRHAAPPQNTPAAPARAASSPPAPR